MGMGRQDGFAIAVRRALSSVAIFAQVILIFTPLVDLHDGDGAGRVIAAGLTTPDAATISAQQGQPLQHNPTTCPACIAQSLHAQLSAAVRLPTVPVAERSVVDRRSSALPQHDPPATLHSRAPPVVS
jgi:hypothetical protein